MSPPFIKKARQLIEAGQFEDLIHQLQDGNNWIPYSAQEEMQLLAKRLRQLRQKELRGLINAQEYNVEKEAIKKTLLQFVESYDKKPKHRDSLQLSLIIACIFLLVLLLWCWSKNY